MLKILEQQASTKTATTQTALQHPSPAIKCLHRHTIHARQCRHPAIAFLLHTVRNDALVSVGGLLRLQATAVGTHAAFCIIHCLLERSVLPSKYIVAMLTVTRVVTLAKIEGLRTIGRPVSFVVELGRVPDNLQ